jgi:Ferritin-like
MSNAAKPVDPRLKRLREHLQWALEVEHFTIPPYLCALYSIPQGTNAVAAAIIQSVAMEEMLHMVLVANLLNAIGGKPRVPLPLYPAPLPHIALLSPGRANKSQVVIPLQKFSPAAVKVFMAIERPDEEKPGPDGVFHSIGQFYDAVHKELKDLLKGKNPLSAAEVFSGDVSRQISGEFYYGGEGGLMTIGNLEQAELAIREIVDQGEGLHGDVFEEMFEKAVQFRVETHRRMEGDNRHAREQTSHWDRSTNRPVPAHYFRFRELYVGRYYQKGDKATCAAGGEECMPTGPQMPVQWDAVYPMRPNPKAIEYMPGTPIRQKLDEFNRCYTEFCELLQDAFSGRPELMAKSPAGMFEIRHRAIELMRIPDDPAQHDRLVVDPTHEGAVVNQTVGPTFEQFIKR